MSAAKNGAHTFSIEKPVYLSFTGAIAGPKEGKGPLAPDYDVVKQDLKLGQKSFEKAERMMMKEACDLALSKGNYRPEDLDYFIAGDLLNQITVSGYSALNYPIPFLGIYGACANLTQSMGLGALLISGGYGERALLATSSHNCSAERQYRYPTEYGFQKPCHAQWTVTGAGAAVITADVPPVRITTVTLGELADLGMRDPACLGTAMAPAAAAAMVYHFEETGRDPSFYDAIVSGDLGQVGKELAIDLLFRRGYNVGDIYNDCGTMIYYPHQQVNSGGSGCAASALVVLGNLFRRLSQGEINRALVVATGAMHSPTACLQGDSIPALAYAVSLENETSQ